MIETDEQRRWWFANHPEYTNSRRGKRNKHDNHGSDGQERVSPEAVDAYVDEALKHLSGPEAALLRSVKRHFGTEAELSREQQNLKLWETILQDGWGTPAGTYAEGSLYISEVPRMPTMDELSRWPREMVGRFFKWVDTILENNPLLMDPNALESHHGLPKAFIRYFMDCGMRLDEFIMIMRASDHRLRAEGEGRGGVHTGEGRGGDWNTAWGKFIEWHPAENTPERRREIRQQFNEMVKTFGLEGKYILPPKKPRRK